MIHEFSGFPGTQRYVPKRLLGMGGMGAVYEVEDNTTGGRLALKVMLTHHARRLLRFKHEFRVMAELHHPNLVRLFDLGQHEGKWFFTMELVHGQDLQEALVHDDVNRFVSSQSRASSSVNEANETLHQTIAEAPERQHAACDPDVLIGVTMQILDALEFLHGHGIVHRDLKPSNILVDLDGNVRLLDFGLVNRIDGAATISQEGAIVGTLAYLSPEQYRGASASPASDLYALGCMLFELLTGQLPFRGSPIDVLSARLNHPPPRVDEILLDVPAALVDTVHRLMARDPMERPTIDEVRNALGATRASETASSPVEKRKRSNITAEIFVGRRKELALLANSLERAAGGEAQIAFISGPSGIGKSALATMIVRRAQSLGFLCFNGRCYEREQVPFVAFDRVMDAITLTLKHWSPTHLAVLRPWLHVMARIFPTLGLLTGQSNTETQIRASTDPREMHQHVYDSFRHFIAYCQTEAPLCFILDDLQWADEESLALLSAILEIPMGRFLIVGLFRMENLPSEHPLHRLLRTLDGRWRGTTIALPPLDSHDATHLVETVTGHRLDPSISAALAHQAAGNPFLVRRLAEHLSNLATTTPMTRLDAPTSADDFISALIRALSSRAEHVLSIAATAGAEIDMPLLREASGLDSEEFDLGLGELMAARFLKAIPTRQEAESRFDVYHDRIREVAYQRLSDERRRTLHRNLALALEAQSTDGERDAEALVRHYGGAGDRAMERRYAQEAAEQAASKLAFLRAARLFCIVLDDPDPGEDPLVTAARWEHVGDLFEYSGYHLDAARAYQQALQRWDEAHAEHPQKPIAQLRLCGLAGTNLLATEHIREGRALFEKGLAFIGLPVDRPLAQRIAIFASIKAQGMFTGRFTRNKASKDEAPLEHFGLRVAFGAHRPQSLLATTVRFLDLMMRAFMPLWPLPATEAALRVELLAHHADDLAIVHRSIVSRAAVPVFLGPCSPSELEQSHAQLDKADELASQHEIPLGHELVQLNRSLLWLATNTTRARQTCEKALEGFDRRGMRVSLDANVARCYYLYILLIKGDDDDILALIERELDLPKPSFINLILFLAQKVALLACRGLCEDAKATRTRLVAHLDGAPTTRIGFTREWTELCVLIAEGRFAEAFANAESRAEVARANGTHTLGLDWSMWQELELEVALGVLRQQGMSRMQRMRIRFAAEWLARRGAFDFRCMGYRALALLEHAEGNSRAATSALRRALSLSSTNTRMRMRWLCLEAARDLGSITREQEAETAELAAVGKFVLPIHWRG